MIFNSFHFLVFFLAAATISFFLPADKKKWLILLASAGFYFWLSGSFLIMLFALAVLNFFLAFRINNVKLYSGIILNLLTLFSLKYFISFERSVFEPVLSLARLAVPVGISFYTLKNIGYLLDVKRGKIQPAEDFPGFFTYLCYFPSVLAGPLLNQSEFEKQLRHPNPSVHEGLQRVILGFFKKLVVADAIALSIDPLLENYQQQPGFVLAISVILYSFRLYFDFSGYTDMAIGFSGILGITLPENFISPFRSSSVSEFWRRWHISLTSWFQEYVFFPLSFRLRKMKKNGLFLAIIITFILSGMWHGVGLTFVIWALLHGFYLVMEKLFNVRSQNRGIKNTAGLIVTFLLVTFTKIFFFSPDIHAAAGIIERIFTEHDITEPLLVTFSGGGTQEHFFNFYVTIFFLLVILISGKYADEAFRTKKISPFVMTGLVVLILMFGIINSAEKFIYTSF